MSHAKFFGEPRKTTCHPGKKNTAKKSQSYSILVTIVDKQNTYSNPKPKSLDPKPSTTPLLRTMKITSLPQPSPRKEKRHTYLSIYIYMYLHGVQSLAKGAPWGLPGRTSQGEGLYLGNQGTYCKVRIHWGNITRFPRNPLQ